MKHSHIDKFLRFKAKNLIFDVVSVAVYLCVLFLNLQERSSSLMTVMLSVSLRKFFLHPKLFLPASLKSLIVLVVLFM